MTGPIIVVCQVFHPDDQSTSQLLSGMMAALAPRHEIRVLTGYPAQGTENPPGREQWQGVEILRGGGRFRYKKNRFYRLLAYALYSLFVFRKLLFAPRGSRVFVITNPPFGPVLVGIACWFSRLRWTPMLLDIFPDGLTALGTLRRGSVIDRLWSWANRRAFLAAADVWVIGRDMVSHVRERYGVPVDKIRYVPHWSPVEVDAPRRAEQTAMWQRLKLDGKFVVQYSGNMGLWHDLDTIVRAAGLLKENSNIHFLFIGAGMRRRNAEQLASELGLNNVTWLPYQKKEDLDDSLACCHAALISQAEGLEGVAVPCKLYGILSSGRAVVAQVPLKSEVAMVLAEEKCGVVVPPRDSASLAGAISRLAANREEAKTLGTHAFAAYEAKYTLRKATETFDRHWNEWARN